MIPPLAAIQPAPIDPVRQGWSLPAMLTLLGVILVGSLLLIIVLRSTRRARDIESRRPPADPRDPWTESARRMSDSIIDFDPADPENPAH